MMCVCVKEVETRLRHIWIWKKSSIVGRERGEVKRRPIRNWQQQEEQHHPKEDSVVRVE